MKCKYCGKEVDTTDKRRRFCSDDCNRLYYNAYRCEKAKRKYAEDAAFAKACNERIRVLARERTARIRREAMAHHASQIMMLSHKSGAEALITDYLLQNFNMRSK